jgi:hypothetical protein
MATVTLEVPAKITIEDGILTTITVSGADWVGQVYVPVPITIPATIADGASLSSVIDLGVSALRSARPGAVLVDAWDAADMSFQVSEDGTTFFDLYRQDGTELTIEIAADRVIVLTPADFLAFQYLKVRSGTTGSPVVQSPAVAVTVFCAQ